ncbi:hypothetical protein PV08_09726 [Exophiala spinifera]|uniref:DUF7702 domain-containing protein n=1 Tax=Exophiala spinifera TaxID=91928 RepID=A0A0D2BMT9_9EURO|nr:uncharacterized protein PV08_09726 [Exophiala spinifera]KIW12449.1 hypothetical protein PV08_09726 [Exophiala spinifera]
MGTVTYRDGIAILQLVVFPFIFAAALFIWKRAGWKAGRKVWRFAVVLALIRIAGSICSLLTISHDSYNLEVAVAVCELIGIAPLLLTYVGILRQIDIDTKVNPKFLNLLAAACFIGVGLGIAGVSTANDSDTTYHPNSIVKASMGVFLAVFAVVVVVCGLLYLKLRHTLRAFQKKLFLASVLSYPFLLVRLVYSALSDYTSWSNFAVLIGDATIYLCMSVLEEIVAIALAMMFGISAVLQDDFVKPDSKTSYQQFELREEVSN